MNCPEAEESFKLSRQDEAILSKVNRGIDKPFKGSMRAPFEAFATRDLAVGPSSNASTLVGTKIPAILAALRPSSLFMKLPLQIIEGATDVFVLPRIQVGEQASPVSEIQLLASTDPSFSATGAGPATLRVQATVSKQLLAQAAGNESMDDILKRDLCAAISQKLDFEIVNGSGVAGDVSGIINQIAALNSFTFGAAAAWPKFCSAQQVLEANFVDQDRCCYLVGPATAGKLRQALRGTNTAQFILQDGMIDNVCSYVTSFLSSTETVILADWSSIAVAIWGSGIDLVVDPYSLAAYGKVVVTAQLLYNAYCLRPQTVLVSTDSGAQ
jgi:HK97 family phage major capsid protein